MRLPAPSCPSGTAAPPTSGFVRRHRFIWLAVAVLVLSAQAPPPQVVEVTGDPPAIPVRSGNHPGFGRVVFDTPPRTRYTLTRDGDRINIRFPAEINLGPPPRPPRNVSRLKSAGAQAEFNVPPGATLREMRVNDLIVIDVLDPPSDDETSTEPTAASKPASPDDKPATAGSPPQTGGSNAGRASPPAAPPGRPAPPKTPDTAPAPAGPSDLASRQPGGDNAGSQSLAAKPATPADPPGASSATAAPERNHAKSEGDAARTQPVLAGTPAPTTGVSSHGTPAPAAVAEPRVPAPADTHQSPAAEPVPSAFAGPAADPAPASPLSVRSIGPLGPVALLARRLPAQPGVPGQDTPAIGIPFGPNVGAASFRRGNAWYVVFDDRRPIDLGALRHDPVFSSASVLVVPGGTVVRLPLAEANHVVLSRLPQAWRIGASRTAGDAHALVPVAADGHLNFAAEAQGRVVSIADPEGGGTLLVGTLRKPGQAVTAGRRTTQFALLPTGQGVVIEALADTIALRSVPSGFQLAGTPNGLLLSPPSLTTDVLLAAARLTRRFQFPAASTEVLAERMHSQMREAALAPPLARGPRRRMAAESMIALGMAAEADALLGVAAAQDPHEAGSADFKGLRAIAAMLAGRLEAASGIEDPRLNGTDEVSFWRAVLMALRQEGSPAAAAIFAGSAPLAFTYPAAMRDRVLPLALETMILGGEIAPAARLLAQREADPALGLARALLAEAKGDIDGALVRYDELANSRDRLLHARANVRAVDLRLASDRIDAAQAADALDKLLYSWRGDWRDLALRERLADLRRKSGNWPAALAVLRDAKADFPAYAADLQSRMQDTFAAMLHDDAADRMAPLEFVMVVENNADLLPASPGSEALENRLADRLLALDLPKRADFVLAKLMQAAQSDTSRAGFGVRLAELRVREGDPAGALSALSASAANDLPAELRQKRILTAAAAQAAGGDTKAALATLAPLETPAAAEARASILERTQDWAGAEQALTELVAETVPPAGELNDAHRRLLLRLATASARAGNDVALAALRAREEPRIGTGPVADMFRLLTADPVRGVGDLKRAQREIGLVRALPAGMKALQSPALTQ
ncbi:MAG: hypothetical protein AB7F35_18445 [Acetobacteraceae bacterium]